MKYQDLMSVIEGVPFISATSARVLYEFILRERLSNILELGFAHGSGTCVMAAALHELGRGRVTAVDLLEADRTPCAEDQLERAGLSAFVELVRMQSGYTWFLHDEIKRFTTNGKCKAGYDFCFIDGPKNWTIDGAAFFMVDKLLKVNGYIIFDDYNWTYAAADAKRDATDGITHRRLSEEERVTPHIREICDLLVSQHPNYGPVTKLQHADWAMVQKISGDNMDARRSRGSSYWLNMLTRSSRSG